MFECSEFSGEGLACVEGLGPGLRVDLGCGHSFGLQFFRPVGLGVRVRAEDLGFEVYVVNAIEVGLGS